MSFNERFIAGRIRPRLLRTPAIVGWVADEHGESPPRATQIALKKIDDELALPTAGKRRVTRLGGEATALLTSDSIELLVGWPERLVIVREAGTVLFAHGDVVHFGPMALDPSYAIQRTGYEYLADLGAEVRVELRLEGDGDERVVMLGPGDTCQLGPYAIEHEQSFDPSDRPGGAKHHGYSFCVRRDARAPRVPVPAGVPHPLDMTGATDLMALARARGLLGADEAMVGETIALADLLERYEGPRQHLEKTLREAGAATPVLRRLGESVEVQMPHLRRGSRGEPCYGIARVILDAAGGIGVDVAPLGTLGGRLRKQHAG